MASSEDELFSFALHRYAELDEVSNAGNTVFDIESSTVPRKSTHGCLPKPKRASVIWRRNCVWYDGIRTL